MHGRQQCGVPRRQRPRLLRRRRPSDDQGVVPRYVHGAGERATVPGGAGACGTPHGKRRGGGAAGVAATRTVPGGRRLLFRAW